MPQPMSPEERQYLDEIMISVQKSVMELLREKTNFNRDTREALAGKTSLALYEGILEAARESDNRRGLRSPH
jgi:hypothetical protein